MERVKAQASKVGKLLFDPKTAETYQAVLTLTWQIIKETALLLWLLICSGFIVGAWIGDNALRAGRNLRTWIDSQGEHTEVEPAEKMAATGKALLDASQNGANFLLNQAREQLGLEKMEIAKPAKPAAMPKAATTTFNKAKAAVQTAVAEAKETASEAKETLTETASKSD